MLQSFELDNAQAEHATMEPLCTRKVESQKKTFSVNFIVWKQNHAF